MSRLAVTQARVRRVIGTCYAIWEGTACRIWPQPAVAAMRLVKTLARLFAPTRGERAAQASLPFRPEGQRNRMRVATAVSPFVGFEQSPWPAAQGRWESAALLRLVAASVSSRLPHFPFSCGWLPLAKQTTAGILGLRREAAQSLFSQRLYAFSGVAPKANPRAARVLGRRFRTPVRCPNGQIGPRFVGCRSGLIRKRGGRLGSVPSRKSGCLSR